MRPLVHPAAADVTVEGILHALTDPVRVQIFANIVGATCTQTCSAFLEVSDRPIPKSTLSQHFNVLREAGLIRSERKGVEMHNAPRLQELGTSDRKMVRAILDAHAAEAARRRAAERPKRVRKAA